MKSKPLLPRKHLPRHSRKSSPFKPNLSKRRIAQLAIIGTGSLLILSGIAGAFSTPTGLNIAAALIISLSLLIEAPLTAMALAKQKSRSR